MATICVKEKVMTKNIAWTKPEICKLFAVVEEYKKNNKPVLWAFKDFARCFARSTGSVRNFYYAQLKEFQENPNYAKNFGVNLALHQKACPVFFSKSESQSTIQKIDSLIKSGHSVRAACKKLSGGEVSLMLRLQNKYHAEKQKQEKQSTSKVLVMPSRQSGLSEQEVNSLVLGLIKLVRRTATESAEKNFETQVRTANFELRRSIKTLAEKEREVELLRQKFEILSTEKQKLTKELELLRSQNVELLKNQTSFGKMNGLKTYIKKLSTKPLVKS